MTEASRRELREWHHALTFDPLAAGDPRYVELQDAGRGAVDEIMAEIELHFDATTQLLSGPSGSGKTTELLRLQRELERAGFRVVLLDATRYVNESAPISITEFLVALGLGASEKLHRPEHTKPAFGARLVALLRRLNVSLDVGPLSASISPDAVSVGALGATLEVDIQRELASNRPFVENVGPALGRLLAPHAEDPAITWIGRCRRFHHRARTDMYPPAAATERAARRASMRSGPGLPARPAGCRSAKAGRPVGPELAKLTGVHVAPGARRRCAVNRRAPPRATHGGRSPQPPPRSARRRGNRARSG